MTDLVDTFEKKTELNSIDPGRLSVPSAAPQKQLKALGSSHLGHTYCFRCFRPMVWFNQQESERE